MGLSPNICKKKLYFNFLACKSHSRSSLPSDNTAQMPLFMETLVFSCGLRNSISHCVGRSVGQSVGLSVCLSFCPPFPFLAFSTFCERFFHHRSSPIKRDWSSRVYGTPHCPCPPHYRSCPTPATYAGSCIRPCFFLRFTPLLSFFISLSLSFFFS